MRRIVLIINNKQIKASLSPELFKVADANGHAIISFNSTDDTETPSLGNNNKTQHTDGPFNTSW